MSAIYYPALHRYIGTSEDEKPTTDVADGTGFLETDTGDTFSFQKASQRWLTTTKPKPLTLTAAEKEALDAANAPDGENAFATIADVADPPSVNTPTADEKAALDAANAPDAGNPFATIADVGGGGGVAEDLTTAETDTSLVLAPDGAGGVEFRAETGGGGSGNVIVSAAVNGLVKDFNPDGFDPDVTTHLFLDPRAQDWQAGHEYSMGELPSFGDFAAGVPSIIHPIANPDVKFKACYGANLLSGLIEPTWPTDGSNIDDNEVYWTPSPAGQFAAAWQALHDYTDGLGNEIVKNGSDFQVNAPNYPAMTSGAVEPDWTTAPNYGDFVVDGDIIWVNSGPTETWQASHHYNFFPTTDHTNYYTTVVVPTVPGDFVFRILFGLKRFIDAGVSEPDWDAEVAGSGHYYSDGEIFWQETEDTEELVVTGLVAPSNPAFLTLLNATPPDSAIVVRIPDPSYVSLAYGDDVLSSAGFNNNGTSGVKLTQKNTDSSGVLGTTGVSVAYVNSQWQTLSLQPVNI